MYRPKKKVETMDDLVLALLASVSLHSAYLSLGDLRRLGMVCWDHFRALIGPDGTVTAWVAERLLPVRLHRAPVAVTAMPVAREALSSAATLSRLGWRRGNYVRVDGNPFRVELCTHADILRYFRTVLCRECGTRTRATARTSTGRWVLLCVSCAKRPSAFSSLCSRADVHLLNSRQGMRKRKRVVDDHMQTRFTVARRGGNRAILYWRHEVERFLGTSSSSPLSAH